MITQNELSYPNNALFHRQVCFFAQERNQKDIQRRNPLRGKECFNIIKVNDIPNLSATKYPSDQALMSDSELLGNANICIFSSGLALDSRSSDLYEFFCSKLKPIVLSNDTPLFHRLPHFAIGLKAIGAPMIVMTDFSSIGLDLILQFRLILFLLLNVLILNALHRFFRVISSIFSYRVDQFTLLLLFYNSVS